LNVLTPKQFAAFTPKRRAEIRPGYVYIPRNEYGIRSGYYRDVDITRLLRENFRNETAIVYVARRVARDE